MTLRRVIASESPAQPDQGRVPLHVISYNFGSRCTFDQCPFCDQVYDGHPEDIVSHMNHSHPAGEPWVLVKYRNEERGLYIIAAALESEAQRKRVEVSPPMSGQDEAALGKGEGE